MGGDNAANALPVGVDDREEPAIDLANRNHADFAVPAAVVDKADDPPFEHPGGVSKIEPAFRKDSVAFDGVEVEVHEQTNTLSAHMSQAVMCAISVCATQAGIP